MIGEGANKWVIRSIRELLQKQPNIEHVNEVLTMHMGPDFILANISVDFADDISVQQMEVNIAAIDSSIKQTFPQIKRVFIEAEKRRRIIPQET